MKWFGKSKIQATLQEKRALPTGVKEFHEWSDRIIQGSALASTPESQKFALCTILLNLPPTTAFEADVYFIQCLRKSAANQIAEAMRKEIRDAAKARLEAEEEAKKAVPLKAADEATNPA
jgi:hypothetical protein